jgi:oligosaccharide repeat unit polymerase
MKHKIIYLLSILILIFKIPSFNEDFNKGNQIFFISLYFISIIVHLVNNLNKNWFRIDLLFIISFSIVHLQWALMLCLSLDLLNFTHYNVNTSSMNYGVWLSCLGGISWLLGYSIYKIKNTNLSKPFNIHIKNFSKVKSITIIFFIFFILTAGKDFFNGAVYVSGSGNKATGEGISVYFQEFFSISILVYTSLVFIQYKNNTGFINYLFNKHKIYLFLIISYTTIFLSIGDRGGPIQLGVLILIAYSYMIKYINLYKFLLLLSIGGLFMTVIGLGRGSDSSLNTGFDKLNFESGAFALTMNLANSNRVLNSAINYIEENDYFYGKLMIGNILGVLPFSQSAYLITTDAEKHTLSSSSFFTYLKYGKNAPSGEGTTLIADIFINFGSFGVFLLMLIFGCFYRKIENEIILKQNFKYIIISLVVASSVIYIGRANLLFSVKAIIWSVLILKFLNIYEIKKHS